MSIYFKLLIHNCVFDMDTGDRFIVELVEDIVTGDLLLPIPQAIISECNWFEGTELSIEMEGDEIIIKEVN